MTGATLDAGALIALDRGTPQMSRITLRAHELGHEFAVPAGVLAQAWRDGRTQVRLARFLASGLCVVVPLEEAAARAAGRLCAATGTRDVIDASVVIVARQRGDRIITSDPDDLRTLDPTLEFVVV